MEMAMAMERKGHVLVFPFPAQGHMIPLLDLSLSLASHGLAITLPTTTISNEPLLSPLLSAASMQGLRVQSLLLPLPPTEGLLPDVTMANISLELLPLLIYSCQGLERPLEHWLLQQKQMVKTEEYGPDLCIISDFFLGWAQETGAKVDIPRIVFSPSGAFALSVLASLWEHMPHLGVDSDEAEVDIPDLPHPLTLRKFQLSRLAREYRSSDPLLKNNRTLESSSPGRFFTADALQSYLYHPS